MDALEQSRYIRRAYLRVMDHFLQKKFLLRLAAVRCENRNWYDRQLRMADLLSAQVDAALMQADPHRALRYVCALSACMRKLKERANRDFDAIEGRLIRQGGSRSANTSGWRI